MIYALEGVAFLTAVKVRDIVSREVGSVYRTRGGSALILAVCPCLPAALQCVVGGAAGSSSGWLVWSGWEDGVCGAVCCGLRFTTGTVPPPASALAKAPTRCYPHRAALCRNASEPRSTANARLLCSFSFIAFMTQDPTNLPSMRWSLFNKLSWLAAVYVMQLGHTANPLI